MKKKVIYVTADGIFNSVFDSQVMVYMERLQEKFDMDLIAMDRWKTMRSKTYLQKSKKVAKRIKGVSLFLPRLPHIGHLFLFFDFLTLRRTVRRYYSNKNLILFHARGHFGSYLALRVKEAFPAKDIRIIADLRADFAEEVIRYCSPNNPILKMVKVREIRRIEREICSKAERIFCVSKPFKYYLLKKYSFPENKISIIPTCVNIQAFRYDLQMRENIRKRLKLDDKFIIVYNGSMHKWEWPEKSAEVFLEIKKIEKRSFFLVITRDVGIIQKVLKSKGIKAKDYAVFSLPHQEVPNYLVAADLGLLLRQDNPVNRVASPTKFAEYLACGVPVLINRRIGDTESIVEKFKVGIIYENEIEKKLKEIFRQRKEWAVRCVSVAKRFFDLNQKIVDIAHIYEEILQEND